MNKKILPFTLIIAILTMVLFMVNYAKDSANTVVDFHNDSYVGADKCRECHEENYESWKNTYHRTMTQEASNESVVGDFDGSLQTYWGISVRPIKINNKYFFEYYDPNTQQKLYTLEIKRTVGSRRYQQYLAQTDNTEGNYYRLELLWHIEDNRWVHLNGAFLGSDHQAFDNHTAVWNQNCIFCHNTGTKPNMINYDEIIAKTKSGKPLNLKQDTRFKSHVSDLGIGCESCHANGQEHIDLNQNPVRKYYLHYSDTTDKSIINPSKLSASKSMDICGQCHGQRTPKSYELAREWMENGPTYRPGDDLQEHVNPVFKKSVLNSKQSEIFKQRFWYDGTPRLTAYEYQGLLQSQCYIQGDLTCNDCHSMHDGNPKGMIKKDKLTNQACTKCHQNFKTDISSHTGHKTDSEGSLCYNCHMPKIVYGIMTFHRSHKIESPNPATEFANDKPNACIACHQDKSANWVVTESKNIWPNYKSKNNIVHSDIIQSINKLHSGDPVERAIAAFNISHQSKTLKASDLYFLIPHLLYSLEDSYPAIRRFSYKSINKIIKELSIESDEFSSMQNLLKTFDFITDYQSRSEIISKANLIFKNLKKTSWRVPPTGSLLNSSYQLDKQTLTILRNKSLSDNKLIQIGE